MSIKTVSASTLTEGYGTNPAQASCIVTLSTLLSILSMLLAILLTEI